MEVEKHLHAVVRRWMGPDADGINGWRLDKAAGIPLAFQEHFDGWVNAINRNAYITGHILDLTETGYLRYG